MSSTLANHYIRPEDLSPLPTTLDAKKSPLALLAQTCSNIGADLLPNNKPIIPPFEKKKKPSNERAESVCSQSKNNSIDNRSNSVGSVDTKISFKPYETNNTGNKSSKSDTCYSDTSRSNSVDVIVDKKPSTSSSSTEQKHRSPSVESKSASSNQQASSSRTSPSSKSSASQNGSQPLSYSSSGLSELSKSQLTTFSKSDSLSTACKTTSSLVSCMNGYSNYGLNASGAALLHNDLMKSSHYSPSLLFPYLNQSPTAVNSLKAATVCRDPYCKGCQLSAATALNANLSCANGCNGCVHSVHSHPLHGCFLPQSLASYSPQVSSAIPSVRPFVCNWTVGGTYCGKSFASCEELFQHLKSHTNVGSSPIPGFGSYYSPGSLPPTLASISAFRSAPNHSTLESFRYHPYKLAQGAVPSGVPPSLAQASPGHLPSLTGSPLASYYPTYNMYNGRI
ncbi:zinc finger protein-like protein [Dinothrombium tinctorium]|uniref:Zinc finger protein-like protein n=1 Tax=Dinothrombium tinctorium TaxID=1965070 RepID=A0A443QIF6_9ACAR|nr:zinc finger protein-like protein [Dinothrombium tinctorium]